ncbi:tetratricopeptide repeat protein [Aliiglaciecola litoralis]|uniref:Tetratricopeptide repeat protein n=1 Tax=Aliiglaciecola litoralis TaxID=582857 RepID=A0ABN1LPS0_9ALTE
MNRIRVLGVILAWCMCIPAYAGVVGEKSFDLIFDPNHADTKTIELVIEGLEALNQHKYRQAKTHFRQAAELNEQDPIPMLGLAKVAMLEQQQGMAKRYLNQALTIAPQSPEVHASLGRFYALQSNYEEAQRHLSKAVDLHANSHSVFSDLGFLYLNHLREPEKARKTFTDALAVASENPQLHYGLALSYANLARFAEAEAELLIVTQLLPNDATAYQTLGRLYAQQHKFTASLATIERAIELNDAFVPLKMDRADVLAASGKLDHAIDQYKKIVKLTPDSALPLVRLGALYEAKQQQYDAIQAYQKAIALDPNQAIAYNALAWLYVDDPINRAQAIRLSKKAVALSHGEPAFIDTLAWLHRADGNLVEAERLLNTAIAKQQTPAAILYYHLGLVQHELRNTHSAIASLNKAVEIDRNFEYANNAQELLRSMRNQ